MSIFKRSKPLKSTRFSDFIRNASSGEKKKVYKRVLEEATKAQTDLIDLAAKKKDGSTLPGKGN